MARPKRVQTPQRPAAPPPPPPRAPAPQPRAQRPVATPPTDWRTHALPIATIAIAAAGLYWPSLHGAFVYDDPNAISQSALIHHLTPLTPFLTLSTRPLTDYSYALNYAIAGLATWP